VLTAAWDGTDTGDLLHDKAGRSVCLNQRQPAPMGSFFSLIGKERPPARGEVATA
jgi:hypothetical protein